MTNLKSALIVPGLLFIIFVLAACQGPAPLPTGTAAPSLEPPTSPPPTQTMLPTPVVTPEPVSALGVEPEELRKVTVAFWYSGSEAEAETLRELSMTFNASNPWGVWVEPIFVGSHGELMDRITAGQETGDLPDAVLGYPEVFLGLEGDPGLIVDLDPYVQDPIWGMSPADQGDFYPAFWQAAEMDGRRVGIPAPRSAGLLFYNRTWAQELGFDRAPTTPEEFKQQACAAAQANDQDNTVPNNGTGGWVVRADALAAESWIAAFGGQISRDGGATYTFTTPQMLAAFDYLKSLVEQGCAWVGRNPDHSGYLADRYALFYTGAPADIAAQERASGTSKLRDAWSLLPYPGLNGRPVLVTEGPVYSVLQKTPPKQLAAWLWIRWLSQPENQARLVAAGTAYPVRASTAGQLSAYRSQHPQWAEALAWLPESQASPHLPSWTKIRPVLADAAFQFFNPNARPEPVADILARLEQTAAEILQRQP